MVLVLTKPKNALVKQYKYLFALSDVDFHITDGALREIATVALSKNTGARGLRAILENILLEAMFLVPERADVTVYIDDAVVRGDNEKNHTRLEGGPPLGVAVAEAGPLAEGGPLGVAPVEDLSV